jgi:hypothetical protein
MLTSTFFRRIVMKNKQLWMDLSNEECRKVVGGVGIGDTPGTAAGFNGWGAPPNPSAGHGLLGAGFEAGDSMIAGESGNTIQIPGVQT